MPLDSETAREKGKLTSEQAREMGKKGGKKSAHTRAIRAAEKAALDASQSARDTFQQRAEDLAKVLIDAALGRGDFAQLAPKDRAGFAVRALEYGVGRPRPMTEEPPPSAPEPGLHFELGPTDRVEGTDAEDATPDADSA